MNIFHQESFWLVLYLVLAIISGALFWHAVERDLRRYKEAQALGLEPEQDGGEHGWTPGMAALMPLVVIFWPIAWAWLAVIAVYYFFRYSFTWYSWRTGAWAWFKDCCSGVWSWRPTHKAKAERVMRRIAAASRTEAKKREKASKAAVKAAAEAK